MRISHSIVPILIAFCGCAQTSQQRENNLEVSQASTNSRDSNVSLRANVPGPQLADDDGYVVDPILVSQVNFESDDDDDTVESSISEPERASLESLETLALQSNPTLAELQARIDAANGRWQQVGLKPNPNFGVSGQEIGNDGRAGQYGAFLGQEFVRGNKLGLNRQAAAWDISRVELELDAQRLRVLNDVRSAFYRALVAQERVVVARQLSDIADQAVEKAKELVREQEPETVLTQAEIEAELADMVVANMLARQDAQWRSLVAVIGQPNLAPQVLEGELSATATEIVWDEALARIQSESPEIAVAEARVEQLRWALRRACAEATPNMTVQAGLFYDEASSDPFASLQLSMPIPIRNWNQGGIAEARAKVAAANSRVQRTQLNLQERLAKVFQEYEQARQQTTRYEESILAKAKQNLELNKLGYDSGQASYLAVLTAQRSYSQTQLARLNALEQLWSATIQIEGLLLKQNLNQE